MELGCCARMQQVSRGYSNLSEAPVQTDVLALDLRRYELRRGSSVLKLEKIPMELLILLVERRDQLVGREEIIARLWGKDVFLDTEQGINTAIRKIRLTLGDDPNDPRFLQTIVGKGYRFVGPITVIACYRTGSCLGSRDRSRKPNLVGQRPRFGGNWSPLLLSSCWLARRSLHSGTLTGFAGFHVRRYIPLRCCRSRISQAILPMSTSRME